MIKHTHHFTLTLLLSLLITSGTAHAKWFGLKKSKTIESAPIRAVAVGLEGELKVLELLDAELQSVGQLSLRKFAFSKEFTCPIVEGQLRFGAPDGVDKKGKPKFRLVASLDWQESDNEMCLLFLPKSLMVDGKQAATDYTIQLLDMGTDSFELGHTQFINLTSFETKVHVGEHTASLAAWDELTLPTISEVNDMNMAPMDVSYIEEGTEHKAFNNQLRILGNTRHIAFIYSDHKNDRVTVRILKDSGHLFD